MAIAAGLDEAIEAGIKQGTRHFAKRGAKKTAQALTWDSVIKGLNPETLKAIPQEFSEKELRILSDKVQTKPEEAKETLNFFQSSYQDGESRNFLGRMNEWDHEYSNDVAKARLENSKAQTLEYSPIEQAPTRYDVEGREGLAEVRGKLSAWLHEQNKMVGGDPSKIKRENFAPEGIFIDGQERGISGITKHLKDGSPIKLNALGPAQARAKQADPAKIPVVVNYLEEGHKAWVKSGGKEGVHPDLDIAAFRSHIMKGARKADDLTSELAEKWGIKLDKEHMASLGGRGSNDPRSQMPGSETLNRRMGKIDSFSNEVMLILGLPGSGGKAAKKYKNPKVQAKANQREQVGWLQSVTDWVATDGASLDDMASWNPGDLLTNSDKLRIQRAFKTGNQIEVAQTILAERQIAEAYRKAGLGTTPNEKAILNKVLKNIDTDEKVLKAKAKK